MQVQPDWQPRMGADHGHSFSPTDSAGIRSGHGLGQSPEFFTVSTSPKGGSHNP